MSASIHELDWQPTPPAGKFPTPVSHAEDLGNKITEVRSTIKFQLKKVLCLGVAVGHIQMNDDQVLGNVMLSAYSQVTALIGLLVNLVCLLQALTSSSPCSRRIGKTSSRCTSKRPWASPFASTSCGFTLSRHLRAVGMSDGFWLAVGGWLKD